jgi:tetratricopeptide (TPR) repeat protein
MSGKFRICFISIISFLLVHALAFGEYQELEQTKTKLYVNGFSLVSFGKKEILGIRAKGVADLFFRKGEYSRSIKYYEQASRYLTNEADIYYNLGNIYAYEKVYHMAASYYKLAMDKYTLPENLGKTQKYYYLALIRYGFSLEKSKDIGDNHSRAERVAAQLIEKQEMIKRDYPEIADELDKFYKLIYGNAVIQPMH